MFAQIEMHCGNRLRPFVAERKRDFSGVLKSGLVAANKRHYKIGRSAEIPVSLFSDREVRSRRVSRPFSRFQTAFLVGVFNSPEIPILTIMWSLLYPAVILGLLFVVLFWLSCLNRRPRNKTHRPNNSVHSNTLPSSSTPNYTRRLKLCTSAELRFFQALKAALPSIHVMAKVRLEDVISADHLQAKDKWLARQRIKSRHLDFVACSPSTLEILFAIELDDSSHASRKQKHSDNFKNKVLHAAGIPLYRFQNQPSYSLRDIREKITPPSA